MLYLMLALMFLLLVVFILRKLDDREPLYITTYALLLVTGFLGVVALTTVIPLWEKNTSIAIIIAIIGLLYSAVTVWGVVRLKDHHFGS